MKKIQLKNISKESFDFVVIGGGATGVGIALEAVTRGYSVALFEKSDFTKSTSSKSTKLVHGGVRYLAQGNISLVREAAIERGLLVQNASHLVKNISFVIPAYGFIDEIKYGIGLKLYDFIAGKLSLGKTIRISKKNVFKRLFTLEPKGVSGGIVYHDGQFDDSRLAINVLQSAVEHGAKVFNYTSVTGFSKDNKTGLNGVLVKEEGSEETYTVYGKQIVNATGVFADTVLKMDDPKAEHSIVPSQGTHLVLDRSFLPGEDAIMIPKTRDGRVLFLVPWHHKVIVGTTDILVEKPSLEPVALKKEVDFILETANAYLTKKPTKKDVLSVFAGLRPLVAPKKSSDTKEISRSHSIMVSETGMITMVGGKWTTFRKMAEELVDKAEGLHNWSHVNSKTRHLKIHGYVPKMDDSHPMYFYGSDKPLIEEFAKKEGLENYISETLKVIEAQVVWAVRNEMAVTVEDFLARRTRCQLLDAKESIKMAPAVAKIMAKELGKDTDWETQQIATYKQVTNNYIMN